MARSDNWRINKSGLMAVEGAQILKALQKVAGAAGLPSGYKIKFATKGHESGIDFDRKEIVIGAGRLFQEAPIPGELFDVLVGLVLHEVGHEQIGTDCVWAILRCPTTDPKERELFHKFVNIGEDVVIESKLLANPNIAEYEKTLETWAVGQIRDAKTDRLMELWIEYALAHKAGALLNLPDEMVEPMKQLVALTGWLRHCPEHKERTKAYLSYWNIVKDFFMNPPKLKKTEQQGMGSSGGQSEDSQQKDSMEKQPENQQKPELESESMASKSEPKDKLASDTDSDAGSSGQEPDTNTQSQPQAQSQSQSQNNGTAEPPVEVEPDEMEAPLAPKSEDKISEELAQEIEAAVQSDTEDITAQVQEEFGENSEVRFPILRSRETKTPLIKPDQQLRKRLERIMTIRKRLQARTMHGEQYGRIDQRHLGRVATDQRIFSLRYKFPDGFPNTRILLDLSGSMEGHEADEVLEAAGALQSLVNAEVWCYKQDGGVKLVRMDNGNRMIHRFEPGGNTPSGLAIVGVALGLKRGGLVVHLTDGEHNCGQQPWNANWKLKENGIELVNIIWGTHTRCYDLEGMNVRKIRGLAEFPDALYEILVEKAKLSSISGKK